jgi:hypothetical protein
MRTGIAALDRVLGGLVPGRLHVLAGPPCSGKTTLLIEVALQVLRRCRTNVVFATAQETTPRLLVRVPRGSMGLFMPLSSLDRWWDALERWPEPEPRIYLLDVVEVGIGQPACLAHWLLVRHPARCGLLVSNGSCVQTTRPTQLERIVEGRRYWLDFERPARAWRASEVGQAVLDAAASGIPAMYGVGTCGGPDRVSGPSPVDLGSLGPALQRAGAPVVMLHRPELYLAHDEGRRDCAGLVTLSVNGDARVQSLTFDETRQTLRDVVRH